MFRRTSFRRVLSQRLFLGRAVALVMSSVVVLGCGGDTTGPIPANQLFWRLPFNWHAVNMALDAPYNTMQLTAIPVAATGDVLTGVGPVRYTAADSTVTVDSTGRITAHYATNQTWVAASLTVNGLTITDTAFVRVTQHDILSAPVTTLSIQAKPGGIDSASIALDKVRQMNAHGGGAVRGAIPAYVTTGTGTLATDTVCTPKSCPLLIAFASSNDGVASIDGLTGQVTANTPGYVTFTASSWMYGVGLRDSLAFTVNYRIAVNFVQVYAGGSPSQPVPVLPYNTLLIALGGNILVHNNTTDSVEFFADYQTTKVHFQGSLGGTALIDTVAANAYLFPRIQFDSVGTYTYRITMLRSGISTTGTVTVKAGP